MERIRIFRFRVTAVPVAMLVAAVLAGCAGIPKDGRYQTHGGGWDNFRAEAPAAPITRSS